MLIATDNLDSRRHMTTLLITQELRDQLGQLGSRNGVLMVDVINYLLNMARLSNKVVLNESKALRTKTSIRTTVNLTDANHRYLISLTENSRFRPYHIAHDVLGQALSLINTYKLEFVLVEKECV